MPQAIAHWVATKIVAVVVNAGIHSLAAAQAVYAVAYFATYVAVTVAASAGLRALQGTPDIETIKGSKKQSTPPRMKVWGRRGKIGGYYGLWEAIDNYAYDAVYFAEGPCEAIEQVWSHDKVLAFVGGGVGGWVKGSPEYGGGNDDLIHVEVRRGLPTETPYAALVAALSDSGVWTGTCRGDGLVTLGADYHHAKKENLPDDYKNGDPNWSLTARWTPVWDPRTPGQTWLGPDAPGSEKVASGNLGLQILDHCMDPRGMAMDFATEILPALAHWKAQFDICDEAMPLAAGGTEPRYHGSGFAAIPDDPQDALDKMLAACDGKLLKDQHGVWRLWVGKFIAPTVHILPEDIGDYLMDGDAAAQDLANEVVPSIVSEASGWTLVPTTEWRDEAAVARIGRVMSAPMPLEWSNSIPTGRRVGKAAIKRNAAELRGRISARLSAAEALGQRWIRVTEPDLGLDAAVMEMADGGRLLLSKAAVELNLLSFDPTAYDWDAAVEEDSPVVVVRPPVTAPDPPTLTAVTAFFDALAGGEGARLHCVGLGPDRSDLTWFVRWRVTGSTSWTPAEVTDDTPGAGFSGDSGFVASDVPLDVAIGFQTGGGSVLWSEAMTVTADTSALPPPAPTGLTVTVDGANLIIRASAPNVSRVDHLRFWMGLPGTAFEDAADIGSPSASPGQLVGVTQGPVAPGSVWIWATAETASDLASAPAGPFPVTI